MARSVLFTGGTNHAAAAYRAIGYRSVGEYGLWFFRDGQTIESD